eukprot:gnl/Spiro4/22749_TR11233_c1_g9_i1.p1 gnl/Spiro4/22749_TR11233_c1_g9~~gnl/Spiro4/22749_TR11233_c1_g9_i1.p1  ORF type:complete len:240 (-),score=50.02 gnl/Spiro4/22749_TR11233_c1_g9_i1:38-757(-)
MGKMSVPKDTRLAFSLALRDDRADEVERLIRQYPSLVHSFYTAADGATTYAYYDDFTDADHGEEEPRAAEHRDCAPNHQTAVVAEHIVTGRDAELSVRRDVVCIVAELCEELDARAVAICCSPPLQWITLNLAAFFGSKRCIDVLLRNGADPSRTACKGKTAEAVARDRGKHDVVELLRAHAAAKAAPPPAAAKASPPPAVAKVSPSPAAAEASPPPAATTALAVTRTHVLETNVADIE